MASSPETLSDAESGSPPGHTASGHGIAHKVFWPSAILIAAFVVLTIVAQVVDPGTADEPGLAESLLVGVKDGISNWFGWYYTLLVSAFVVFALWVGISHFGDIKLGPDDEKPEFSTVSWLTMLFSAGMGIGLVFFGVAEPLGHFASPKPGVEGSQGELANAGLTQTFLHWGLHPWAIYVVVGLALAYAVHRKGRPVSIRWALEPLLGDRVKGWIGDVIDIAAIVGTLFGVATSLGLGVIQIGAGLDFLGVVQNPGNWTMILLIGGITLIAIASVVSGVGKGIKWLSNFNMGVAIGLMLFVLIAGPTLFLLRDLLQSVGLYFQNLLRLSLDTTALQGSDGVQWQGWWTAFYWGWWISWAPFVGVFIARISRGRTVRQFVSGVLIVPTVFTFLWFTVFGGTALYREVFGNGGLVGEDGAVDTEASLFNMLGGLPGGSIVVGLAILLIVTFFVTSSDSGSLVVDMLASGGNPEPPTWSRVFWASAEGLVAIALLLAGGLVALQAAAIAIALPFSLIMIGIMVASWKAFGAERRSFLQAQRRIQREALTAHVSQSLTEEGLLEKSDGSKAKARAGTATS